MLPSRSLVGWIWDATNGTRLLTNLVPAGWNIEYATSINNTGVILAYGSPNGGSAQNLELVPTMPAAAPPGTWLLMLSGLALLMILRKLARI